MQDEENKQAEAGWSYTPSNQNTVTGSEQTGVMPMENAVMWSASEYITHPKNSGWYAMLAGVTVLVSIAVYLLTTDMFSTAIIVVLGVIVGVFAARQPSVLDYRLDSAGIHIGQRSYLYSAFKSFSLVSDGPFGHISLSPLRRFMPPLAIHYAPEDEDKIIDMLADYLPYEEPKRDIVEGISRRVRF